MSFWANALGTAPAPQQPTYQPKTAWWQTPAVPQVPEPQEEPQPVAVQPSPTRTRAQSARLTEHCPECDSENYFQPSPNTMQKCYECGYNPRFVQSTQGAGMPSDSGAPAQAAKQISTQNNFNPQGIIGRIE